MSLLKRRLKQMLRGREATRQEKEMPFPRVTSEELKLGLYSKWDSNTDFDKKCLKICGLPEDYCPNEYEAYQIVVAALESDD